ncbi:MAG: hypothetical protein IT189_00995 [Microbacteriaceae bacterium]|nr:hypothetical protein [Microbacteriaceae bacterium]
MPLSACCAPIIDGRATAPTAERLMRSRFTAFALGDADYLLKSWHPTTRPRSLQLDPDLRWYRLDIIGRSKGGLLDTEGIVEFVAHYRSPAGIGEQRENSRFLRDAGEWRYLAAVGPPGR